MMRNDSDLRRPARQQEVNGAGKLRNGTAPVSLDTRLSGWKKLQDPAVFRKARFAVPVFVDRNGGGHP